MIRAIIIDDEESEREQLVNYLKTFCPEVTVIEQAKNIETGVSAINKHQPDVVFLDTIFSSGSGFNLLKQFKEINFKIVFVTSYSQYAIKAFKYNAFDYLLKPIEIEELQKSIHRLKTVLQP